MTQILINGAQKSFLTMKTEKQVKKGGSHCHIFRPLLEGVRGPDFLLYTGVRRIGQCSGPRMRPPDSDLGCFGRVFFDEKWSIFLKKRPFHSMHTHAQLAAARKRDFKPRS